ncbi:MAG: hypothetical protein HLUCCO03_11655 [Marinobacter sp. HL-58]|nr:MAG: hypothetical protein HLUCCO03_11655 [Marinobacter sp. HL-58]
MPGMTAELFLPDAPVLMLHRVLQKYEPDNYYFRRGTAISWTRFESLVVWAEAQRAKGFPTPVFTFDDGYSDNQAAFQVLLNKQLPVILFPVRDYIQTGFSVIDDMAARLNGPDCSLSPRITRSLLSGKLKRCLSALSPAEYRYYRARWFGIMDDADAAPFLAEACNLACMD